MSPWLGAKVGNDAAFFLDEATIRDKDQGLTHVHVRFRPPERGYMSHSMWCKEVLSWYTPIPFSHCVSILRLAYYNITLKIGEVEHDPAMFDPATCAS